MVDHTFCYTSSVRYISLNPPIRASAVWWWAFGRVVASCRGSSRAGSWWSRPRERPGGGCSRRIGAWGPCWGMAPPREDTVGRFRWWPGCSAEAG
jgi:hypothetical protein